MHSDAVAELLVVHLHSFITPPRRQAARRGGGVAMESSENAPASPEQGDDVVPREAARGGEPAREWAGPEGALPPIQAAVALPNGDSQER